jgi:hypothetical protein
MYQIAMKEAPFPDDDMTDKLIKTPNFDAICTLLQPQQHSSARMAAQVDLKSVRVADVPEVSLVTSNTAISHLSFREASKAPHSDHVKRLIIASRYIASFSGWIGIFITDAQYPFKHNPDSFMTGELRKL